MTRDDDDPMPIGARVKFSELGALRSPRLRKRIGTVVGINLSGNALRILFDGSRTTNTIHRSYLAKVPAMKTKGEGGLGQ